MLGGHQADIFKWTQRSWICSESGFPRSKKFSGGHPNEETAIADDSLREIEVRLAATPAEGIQGLAIKLGLHQFLSKHADTSSVFYESAYLDLVRLAQRDPVAEIAARGQWTGRGAAI